MMSTEDLIRTALIREKVNERLVETNEEANTMVMLLFSKLLGISLRELPKSLEEWFIENNISLNLNLSMCQSFGLIRKKS